MVLLTVVACQPNLQTQDNLNHENYRKAAMYNTELGLAYLKQGDRARAKRKLLTALKQDPHSPKVHASLAYFMEQSGEDKEAILHYKKAVLLAPKDGAQLNNYGAFLCRRGQYLEAENYFIKASKDVQYDNTAAALENAGLCAMAIPDFKKAKYYFIKTLKQDPTRKKALYELVKIEMKQQHLKKALSYIKIYIKTNKADSDVLSLAIDVAHKAGNVKFERILKARFLKQVSLSNLE